MNDQRLAAMLLAGVGMGAAFMPWTALPVLGYTVGTAYSGWITFILYSIVLIIAVIGKRNKTLPRISLYGLVILSLLAAGIGVWEIFDLEQAFVSVEYGLYLTALVGLVIPLASLLFGKRKKDSGTGTGQSGNFSYDTEVGKPGAPD